VLHDRAGGLTYAVLLVLTALAWWRTLATPMDHDMAGMGMIMAPSVPDLLAYVGAWAFMMAAMMLPSAIPMIALYAVTQRGSAPAIRAARAVSFALVYLAVWALTGVPIYVAGLGLMAVGPRTLAYVTAAVLVAAGVFQFTPLKRMCLRHCRSPLGFLLDGRWRPGWRGGLALAWRHSLHCLGCCWALMLVLVVAGAMGLPWVLAIACVVAAEKLLPNGERFGRGTGFVLALLGVAVAAHPGLAIALR
jgi:predicted metal-binding membrane protein